jgi:hypothetical protein
MAAGLGFKTFNTGDVLSAADTNGYLMQGVWVFANAAARTAAVTSPVEGNMSYLSDTNSTEYYSGSAWVAIGGSASGLVQISNNTFSAVSAVSIDNNFTSTYRNYKIILQITASSATANLKMRFRASSTDNTNASYNSVIAGFRFDGSQYTPGGTGQTSFFFGDLNSSSTDTYFSADIVAPQLAERTGVLGTSVGRDATGGFAGTGGGYFANTTQFDGLSWFPASGTITGRLLVYGYTNS